MYTVHFIGLWGKKGFLLPELELPEELLFLQTVLEMSVQLSTISSSSLHLVVTKEMILSSRQNEKLVINPRVVPKLLLIFETQRNICLMKPETFLFFYILKTS